MSPIWTGNKVILFIEFLPGSVTADSGGAAVTAVDFLIMGKIGLSNNVQRRSPRPEHVETPGCL